MSKQITALASGLVLGAGLSISGMTNTERVLGFLDLFGQWDPTLAFVMGSGVIITFLGFKLVLKTPGPLFDDVFSLPTKTDVDKPLLLGAILFGLGWGLVGYCPGPALAGLSTGYIAPLMFVPAMVIGLLLSKRVSSIL